MDLLSAVTVKSDCQERTIPDSGAAYFMLTATIIKRFIKYQTKGR